MFFQLRWFGFLSRHYLASGDSFQLWGEILTNTSGHLSWARLEKRLNLNLLDLAGRPRGIPSATSSHWTAQLVQKSM